MEGALVSLEWLGANGPVGKEDCGSDDVYSDMPVGPTTHLSEQTMRSDIHRPPNRANGKAGELRRHVGMTRQSLPPGSLSVPTRVLIKYIQ